MKTKIKNTKYQITLIGHGIEKKIIRNSIKELEIELKLLKKIIPNFSEYLNKTIKIHKIEEMLIKE